MSIALVRVQVPSTARFRGKSRENGTFFFAFVVDFEYFFIKTDEMLEEYINKSASRAFYCGMVTTAIVALVCFFVNQHAANIALMYGFASGWGVAVAVHGVSIGYYRFKESWGIEHDKE